MVFEFISKIWQFAFRLRTRHQENLSVIAFLPWILTTISQATLFYYTDCFLVCKCGIILLSLQGANLYKFFFWSSASYWCFQEVWVALKNMARVAVTYTSSNSYATLELSKLHGCILTRYLHAKASISQFLNITYSSCYYCLL